MTVRLGLGFSIGEARFAWGTTPLGLGHDGPIRGPVHGGRRLEAQVGPVDVRDVRWHAAHGDRPITGVDYGLDVGVASDVGHDEVRRALETWLGPGRTATYPAHGQASARVASTTDWSIEGVEITLSRFGAPRLDDGLPIGGRLFVRADEARLGAPFVPHLREADAPWWQRGTVTITPAPGLALDGRSDALLALYRPDLRRLPPWLTLAPDTIGLWASADWFGIATAEHTSLFRVDEPLHLTLVRLHPARGSGNATLSSAAGSLVTTRPGADGLDALRVALAGRARVRVQSLEEEDA